MPGCLRQPKGDRQRPTNLAAGDLRCALESKEEQVQREQDAQCRDVSRAEELEGGTGVAGASEELIQQGLLGSEAAVGGTQPVQQVDRDDEQRQGVRLV